MASRPLSRRDAFTGLSAALSPTALPASVNGQPSVIEDYRLVMARKDAADASPIWADVERWCIDEAEALARLAASPGDLRTLLSKVIILAERAEERDWGLRDEELHLLDAMKEQAVELLQPAGGPA